MLRTHLLLSALVLTPLLAGGCVADPRDRSSDEDLHEDRGPIGKADLYGQCMEIDINYCSLKSSGNCWCDELCTQFGDCCSDYQDACVDDGPSCDPTLICGQAITCVDGQWYPTTCGPANCDEPMGPCGEPEPKSCGGWLGETCDAGEYCHYETSATCGFADASGVCKPKPEACAQIYDPVCGCDGNDYSNACEAHGAGTSVKQSGDCACPAGYSQQFCWGSVQCVPFGAQC
jgi:hypothetical protein